MSMSHILKMYYGIDVSLNEDGYFHYQNQLYYFCFVPDVGKFLDTYRYYRYLMHMCGIEGYSLVKNHNQDIVFVIFASFYAASALSKNED